VPRRTSAFLFTGAAPLVRLSPGAQPPKLMKCYTAGQSRRRTSGGEAEPSLVSDIFGEELELSGDKSSFPTCEELNVDSVH